MRRAKYSAKKVYLPSVRFPSKYYAKPGDWVTWADAAYSVARSVGRVLGRIDRSAGDGLEDCAGYLAIMTLGQDLTHAYVRWVDPRRVDTCQERAPAALLQWITGDEWPKQATDIPRLLGMVEYGTCTNDYIEARNDPSKPYNNPEYGKKYVLP